jgi:hypothetical protein
MDPRVKEFRESLHGVSDVGEHWRRIDEWVASGETERLLRLAEALEADTWFPETERWAAESVLDHLEVALALTPALSHAEALLELSAMERRATVQDSPDASRAPHRRLRRLSARLAGAQSVLVLAKLLDRYADLEEHQEMLSLLVHEMVLRGVRCEEIPQFRRHALKMRERHHPLAWLPLILLETESEISLPSFHLGGTSYQLPFGPTNQPMQRTHMPDVEGHSVPAVQETTNVDESRRIRSAVTNWEEESNGRSEARTFTLPESIPVSALTGTLLRSLDLECLRDATPIDLQPVPIAPSWAFRSLFAAASTGGAYNSGHYGAYGRYEAWRSIAGMAGASEQDTVSAVEIVAKQADWLRLEAKTEWFYQVAWDFGLIVLRSGGSSLAVLAATDTD